MRVRTESGEHSQVGRHNPTGNEGARSEHYGRDRVTAHPHRVAGDGQRHPIN